MGDSTLRQVAPLLAQDGLNTCTPLLEERAMKLNKEQIQAAQQLRVPGLACFNEPGAES